MKLSERDATELGVYESGLAIYSIATCDVRENVEAIPELTLKIPEERFFMAFGRL